MVSYCTTCMDRLQHLSKTLPHNLNACADAEVEFVVLDYGSKEDVAGWLVAKLQGQVRSGRLRLLRTRLPNAWWAPHAKNICHRAARGEVLCNLDADVFMPHGFTRHLLRRLEDGQSILQFSGVDINGNAGTGGMVALLRRHFESVKGYDEDLPSGWNCEDLQLQVRARIQNGLTLRYEEPICTVIFHDNETRLARCVERKNTYDEVYQGILQRIQEQRMIANEGKIWGHALDLEELRPDLSWAPVAFAKA